VCRAAHKCSIYFNSMILRRLLEHYTQIGDRRQLKLSKSVSPVTWVNINLNGIYTFPFAEDILKLYKLLAKK